jgi:hypothetical protein
MAGRYDDKLPRYTPPVDPGLPGIANGFGLLSGLFQQPAAPLPTPALNPERKDKPGFKWTPEAVMRAQQELAQQFGGKPIAPMYGGNKATPWLGGAANAINGFMSTYPMVQAQRAAEGNERMRQEAVQRAMAAGTPEDATSALAGVPDYAQFAIRQRLESMDPARRAALERQQFEFEQAKTNAPLDRQLKEAQIKQAGTKDARAEAEAAILRSITQDEAGAGATGAAGPGYQPMPPGGPRLQPQSGEVAPGDPNLIKTQAAAGQPAPASQPNQDMVSVFGRQMPREKAKQLGEKLLLLPGREALGKHFIELADKGGGGAFGKEGGNLLDKKTIDATNHIARLKTIEQGFDPKFLEIPTRLKMLGSSWGAKTGIAGLRPNPEQAQDLYRYADFRRSTIENMNRMLNELSGAAVSPQEAERLRASQPDAGTGVFDGDDPVSFQAKSKANILDQKRAIARYNYLRSNGPAGKNPWDVMSLDDIDKVMDQRGAAILKQMKAQNPAATDQQLLPQALEATKREFGI